MQPTWGERGSIVDSPATGRVAAARAVAVRPRLWPAAARQARALVPAGWWRRAPFLPLPDRAWLRFRLTTAYGDPGAPVRPDDLVTWLEWSDTVRVHPAGRVRPTERVAPAGRGEGRRR